jgi:hypothetical protein
VAKAVNAKTESIRPWANRLIYIYDDIDIYITESQFPPIITTNA